MENYTPAKLAFNFIEPKNCEKEKAPIIFLHGMTVSKENWMGVPQMVANATKRKVYAIDARNHGDSEWSDIFDFECNPRDLLNFMDSINADKAIIVGHSMGGMTGIKVALQQPERVEKLIVEDIGVQPVSPQILVAIKVLLTVAQTAIQQVPPEVDEITAKTMIGDFVNKHIPEEMKATTRISPENRYMLKRSADGRYAFKANIDVIMEALQKVNKSMDENAGVYEGPAYFIYGKISPFLVSNDEPGIRQCFPKAELIGIANATHTVHTDCPEEFNAALLKCLSD